MSRFVVSFTNNFVIEYELDLSISSTNSWMKEIVKYDASDLCKINYKLSTGNKQILMDKVKMLYEMADILNEKYPSSIVKEEFFKGNEQDILNRMHIHFPIIHYDKSYQHINDIAAKYNVLIHSLEREFKPDAAYKFVLGFDIHKSPKGSISHEMDKEDYKRFEPFHPFGALVLGYAHVGRQAQELFNAWDLVCPKDQYIPQSRVSGACSMVFRFPPAISQEAKEKYLEKWKEFYIARGGKEFFGCDINDPEIRFGGIKIGQLIFASQDGNSINISDITGVAKIRHLVLTNDVETFRIVD